MTPKPKPEANRRPGAPLGNTNALKHGFYSRRFRSTDLNDLDTHNFSGLQDEITMLRVFIRGVVERSAEVESLDESIYLLRALSLATIGLTRLIRTQQLFGTPRDDFLKLIQTIAGDILLGDELDTAPPATPQVVLPG